MDVL
jgi:prolactin regulatory element-binding protein